MKKGDKQLDSLDVEAILDRVKEFQKSMDELGTGIRIPRTVEGLIRTYKEKGINWQLTYADAMTVYACLTLMLGILSGEDQREFLRDLDVSAGVSALPLLPDLLADLTENMFKEQRRILADEDH